MAFDDYEHDANGDSLNVTADNNQLAYVVCPIAYPRTDPQDTPLSIQFNL